MHLKRCSLTSKLFICSPLQVYLFLEKAFTGREDPKLLYMECMIISLYTFLSSRRGGPVISALDSGSRGPSSSPGRDCVVFLAKTRYSHSASLYPGVEMGTSKLSGKPDEMLGGSGGYL